MSPLRECGSHPVKKKKIICSVCKYGEFVLFSVYNSVLRPSRGFGMVSSITKLLHLFPLRLGVGRKGSVSFLIFVFRIALVIITQLRCLLYCSTKKIKKIFGVQIFKKMFSPSCTYRGAAIVNHSI